MKVQSVVVNPKAAVQWAKDHNARNLLEALFPYESPYELDLMLDNPEVIDDTEVIVVKVQQP